MITYESLGIQRVINASGRMTALGGVALHPEVVAAMAEAASANVSIEALKDVVGRRIATLCQAESAMVTPGAAAGIVIMTAAVVTGGDRYRATLLPETTWPRREIVVQAGHAVNFGCAVVQTIRMGGGLPILAGAANQVRRFDLEGALTANTAGILFVQSHHAVQKGMMSLPDVVSVAREHAVPVLVDAAAEEDPQKYSALGADLVAYSGGKAFEGPTSGFILGKHDLIQACKVQEYGVARPMKVGKETILGLLAALERYMSRDAAAERTRQQDLLQRLHSGLRHLPHTQRHIVQDEAGRAIWRLHLTLDRASLGFGAPELVTALAQYAPPIYPRTHLATTGTIALDPRALGEPDVPTIIEAISTIYARGTVPAVVG